MFLSVKSSKKLFFSKCILLNGKKKNIYLNTLMVRILKGELLDGDSISKIIEVRNFTSALEYHHLIIQIIVFITHKLKYENQGL